MRVGGRACGPYRTFRLIPPLPASAAEAESGADDTARENRQRFGTEILRPRGEKRWAGERIDGSC